MKLLNKKKIDNYGITLIALVLTTIVILILACIIISIATSKGGLINKTSESAFKTKMSRIAEEYELYNTSLIIEAKIQGTEPQVINAGKTLKPIIQDEEYEIDIDEESVLNIKELLVNVGDTEEEYVIIYNNELYYVQKQKDDIQAQWCEEIGIKVFEYYSQEIIGIKNTTGKYENVNGLYMCTPMLNGTGFSTYNTRYLKLNNSGNLVPDNWINKTPPDDWYDYSNQKWANIYIENGGIDSYLVWIPRYVYKQDTSKEQRIDAKFVNIDNEYIDGITNEITTWQELQEQGYMLPEAFEFAETPLPGYWISKYQLSEFTTNSTYPIYYETTSTPNSITVKNIAPGSNNIAKYTYAINGKIMEERNNPDNYTFTNLAKGNKAINVTGLDSNGSIVGSFTYLYKVAEVNAPDTTGFDPDTTFYVYYDDDGIEHNEIPISNPAPNNWYDYTSAYWANIVTRNNGSETYLVWIPRYEFQINSTNQRTYVNFIRGTGTETTAGYSIPEAFWWDKDGDGVREEDEELTGYWISKYQLSEKASTPDISAEISPGSTTIQVGNITGTKITENLKYEYYLNGVKKHESEDIAENYSYEGLEEGAEYTVNIIARDKSTNAYIGACTKKVKTISINAPDISRFDPETTYYVTYDSSENETRTSIKDSAPSNWYNYSKREWANVVTTANNTTTYWVWIPRYEFSIDTTTQRTNINFIKGTGTETTEGYSIPEAFWWDKDGDGAREEGEEITGYWISKYQLSN